MKKRELSKRIEEMRRLIGSNYCDLNHKIEINRRFNDYKRKLDERYQMLLDYLKLEEKEYAELEECEFSTYKGIQDLLDGEKQTEAVKKTKLVKRKVGKTDIPQTGRI